MTYRPRRNCRRCSQDRDQVGGVSHSGLCRTCGPAAYADAMHQIVSHRGPAYLKYRDGLTAYVTRLWGENVPDYPPGPVVSAGSGHNRTPATL